MKGAKPYALYSREIDVIPFSMLVIAVYCRVYYDASISFCVNSQGVAPATTRGPVGGLF